MDGRQFVTGTGFAGLATATLAAPAIAQSRPEVKWRMPMEGLPRRHTDVFIFHPFKLALSTIG
jgi:TRAP-type mannitol/chloroaromatic compound transport system substrate-binding protein